VTKLHKGHKMRDVDHVMKILGMYYKIICHFFSGRVKESWAREKVSYKILDNSNLCGCLLLEDTMKLMLTHTQTHGSRSQFLGDLFTIQVFPNLLSLNFSKNPKLLSRITIRIG
jgi:hypothetical protein